MVLPRQRCMNYLLVTTEHPGCTHTWCPLQWLEWREWSSPSRPMVGQKLLDFMYLSSLLQQQLSNITNGVELVMFQLSVGYFWFYMEWDITQLNLKYSYFWESDSITVNKCWSCYHTGDSCSRIQHHCLPEALSFQMSSETPVIVINFRFCCGRSPGPQCHMFCDCTYSDQQVNR